MPPLPSADSPFGAGVYSRELFDSNLVADDPQIGLIARAFVVYAIPEDVLSTPGLPPVGSPHPTYPLAVANRVETLGRLTPTTCTVRVWYRMLNPDQARTCNVQRQSIVVPFFYRLQLTAGVASQAVPANSWRLGEIPNPFAYQANHQAEIVLPQKFLTMGQFDAIARQVGKIHRFPGDENSPESGGWMYVGADAQSDNNMDTRVVHAWIKDGGTPALQPPEGLTSTGSSPDCIMPPARPPYYVYTPIPAVRVNELPTVTVAPTYSVTGNAQANPDGQGWRTLPGYEGAP